MPANYVLIREVTLNASAASVVIGSIPQTGYTDLKVVVSAREESTANLALYMRFNGSSATAYSSISLQGNGAGAISFSESAQDKVNSILLDANTYTANTFGNTEVYIPNFTGSQNKSFSVDSVVENNATTSYIRLNAGLWSNTAAISSITFLLSSGNIAAGSSFSLYGIAAVGTTPTVVPAASGGDIVTNDGTYWYHTFLSTGVFKPNKNLSCDVLVVAGGGGGGNNGGGGGGAGGVVANAATSLASNAYTVIVGAGGNVATSGTNSVFNTYTAIGGGKGAPLGQTGTSGGSGGGGGMFTSGSNVGGSSTQTGGYGFAGGTGSNAYSSSTGGGAGGGGAGAVGTNAVNSNPMLGAGGVGISGTTLSFINAMGAATATGQLSGGNYYYAGGGSGGPSGHTVSNYGGLGGGANFNASATVNTGGGGGGGQAYGSDNPGAGGSGIVIVRYTMAQ